MMDIIDFDLDMDLHREDDSEEVQWKSSQTSNRALDSLMLEAQRQNAVRASRASESEWNWGGSPVASTSTSTSAGRVHSAPTLFEGAASASASTSVFSTNASTAAPPPRRRTRAPRAQSLSLSLGVAAGMADGAGTPDPAQFLKLVKGVSKQADENAGMRAASSSYGGGGDACVVGSAGRTRQGVKQRTMAARRERPTSAISLGAKGKGKERERDYTAGARVLSRTSSSTSSASISPSSVGVSSPGSNYSFVSGDTSISADTSMTSPEREPKREEYGGGGGGGSIGRTQELMPPPPVPKNRVSPRALETRTRTERLPALDVISAVARAPSKSPSELRLHPHAAPRMASSNAAVKIEEGMPAISPPTATLAGEPRMHPLLQKHKSAAAPPPPPPLVRTSANPASVRHNPNPPPPAPTPARAMPPTYSQSQSQPQRRGPPVLGMRRANTAPLTATGGALSSSQAARKFRPPLLNPVKIEKTEHDGGRILKPATSTTVPNLRTTGNPPPAPVTPAPVRRPAQPASSPSDNSFDEHNTSFDMDELEKVMKEYDDPICV
ncbi:hypothetical protein B0H19DRAFT_1158659 [Mycena capillaripes]|nr:hypothetical protein B0H19DRAFT_1158659 [Mycena capillaripes]